MPWPARIGLGGVCGAWAKGLGEGPETLRGWVRQARIDAGDRPGTTTGEARRTGELEKEVREPGAGGRDPEERVGLSWRRSVSARPADLRLHRRAQGRSCGACADLHRPDRVRVAGPAPST